MWEIVVILALIFLFLRSIWRCVWAILRPIFAFVYRLLIDMLREGIGLAEDAAKALISLVIIIVIVIIVIVRFG